MKYKKILLIGLGYIGLRHLESIIKIKNKIEISIYDIRVKHLNSIYEKKNKQNLPKNIKLKKITKSKFNKHYDLLIIATTAKSRYILLRNLLSFVNIKSIVIEKIAFQSEIEFVKSLNLINKNKINAWVNCTRREYNSYQYLSKIIKRNNIKNFTLKIFGNFEFSSNLIHFIDLFSYLSETDDMKMIKSKFHSIKNSKRDKFFKFSGKVELISGNKNKLLVENNESSKYPLIIYFKSKYFSIKFTESSFDVKIIKNEFKINHDRLNFKHIYISEIMTKVYYNILKKQSCNLSTLQSSFFHHQLFLKQFKIFFNSNKNLKLKSIPIT